MAMGDARRVRTLALSLNAERSERLNALDGSPQQTGARAPGWTADFSTYRATENEEAITSTCAQP